MLRERQSLSAPPAAFTDLLHEHVDVRLGSVQDVSVRVFQALHRDLHRVSVYVDPPGGATSQECPGIRRAAETRV